jgi:predicted hydrocarbon binding protein
VKGIVYNVVEEVVVIERPQCVKRGDDRCVLAVTALS